MNLRAYVAFFSARFRAQLQYRTAALAGIGTQVFFGLINVMVLSAFYASTRGEQPLSLSEAVSYVWLAQALLLVVPFRLDREIATLITTGNVVYELVRPVQLLPAWFARGIADRTAPVLLRALPQLLFSTVVLRAVGWQQMALEGPASPEAVMLCLVSVLAGVLVSVALGLVANATLFWTISGAGTTLLFSTVIWVLSGITIPLPLFPDWFQPVLRLLPFRAMIDVPFQIYLGKLTGLDALVEIGVQLLWVVLLTASAAGAINRGVRRVELQGG